MLNSIESRLGRGGRRAVAACALGVSLVALGGCSNLLSVDLPSELTNEVLGDPVGASMQLNSVIGHFEMAFNTSFWEFHGREDGGEIFIRSPGVDRSALAYTPAVGQGAMPTTWYGEYMISRKFAVDLHDKLEKEWTVAQVPQRAQWLAIASLYQGATLSILGSSICEVTLDKGPLQKPDQIYALAEAALTRALTEIDATGGDFAVPYGISTSARNLAYGLRAQLRWMKGDMAGAKADAEKIPQGFKAYVTREDLPDRRNIAAEAGAGVGGKFAETIGVIDWWKGDPNPATGKAWPAIIPFTGYVALGILPDGRAVRDDGVPIRTAGTNRTPAEDLAVADTRVRTEVGIIQGKGGVSRPSNLKYPGGKGDDIPLVNWKEMVLIRAEIAGGQTAIDLVNTIRTADNLPKVTYADPNNATQIKYMIIEERRRALWIEGRYFFTKLKNLDVLWFPRALGTTPEGGLNLGGGVRFLMPDNEFVLNTDLGINSKATGCAKNEAPVQF